MPDARRAIRHLPGMRRSRIAASGFRDEADGMMLGIRGNRNGNA
jgi:hypothetical protein